MEDLSTFQREYLWELEIPRKQLMELAEAIPEEAYDWRPAEDARTFAAVLVHIASGNLMLLYRAEINTAEVKKFCGHIHGKGMEHWLGMVRRSFALEKTLTGKEEVLDLLQRSFKAVRAAISAVDPLELEMTRDLFGESTTYRRVYMRILCHAQEHMGQAIAYARTMGFRVPWPDPVKMMEEMVEKQGVGHRE